MKYILFTALCAGCVGSTIVPADTSSPSASTRSVSSSPTHSTASTESPEPAPHGAVFIETVTMKIQEAKTFDAKRKAFIDTIKPHYTDFWALIQQRRRQEDETELSLAEFFSFIFPTPLSEDWQAPAVQLWMLYTTYLMIENPIITSSNLTEDIRFAIRDYITKHDLTEWVYDTIQPLAPGIIHYYMIPSTALPASVQQRQREHHSDGSTSITSDSDSTDEEVAFYLGEMAL